jgi:hypothetical protein
MNTTIPILTLILILISPPVFSQTTGTLTLSNLYFNNFEVFYISNFDFDNGQNNPDIFEYSLSYIPSDYTGISGSGTPIKIRIEFEMIADVPSLKLDNRRILYILTRPFDFSGEVILSTQDLDLNLDEIHYTDGKIVPVSIEESEYMPSAEFEAIQSVVMAFGKLPAGDYIFNLKIIPVDATTQSPLSERNVVSVGNPSNLELVAPGGRYGEDNIDTYSLYPWFQWSSGDFMWTGSNCPECGYYIRVSEYDPATHSSVDEALNDDSSLPYPDNHQFYKLESKIVAGAMDLYTAETSFQYPFSGALNLEDGKTYVWQVKKTYPTTNGPETVESEIFAFTIPTMGGENEGGTTQGVANIWLQMLGQMLDADTYNQLFTGELNGYTPTGIVTLNGTQQLTQDQLSDIIAQLLASQISVKSINVE